MICVWPSALICRITVLLSHCVNKCLYKMWSFGVFSMYFSHVQVKCFLTASIRCNNRHPSLFKPSIEAMHERCHLRSFLCVGVSTDFFKDTKIHSWFCLWCGNGACQCPNDVINIDNYLFWNLHPHTLQLLHLFPKVTLVSHKKC